MSSIEERRRLFAKYKEDVKSRGKPFFPNAMFHDTVMSLVVVSIIIVLAIIWHESANGTHAGLLGKEYDDKADSGTFSFVPRPDWYFYFLFYLLRIFKWPDSVILGTEREHQGGSWLDQAEQAPAGRGARGEAVRADRLPELPQLPRQRWRLLGRAGPVRGRLEGEGNRVPDQPPEVPVVRERRLPDAALRCARGEPPAPDRNLPRSVEGRQIASRE